MTAAALSANSAAAVVARFLKARGVDRIFALCGGHIMPIWMRVDAEGIAIVDVRDERLAVYMAHPYGELTRGLGVALVIAGPGVTNGAIDRALAHRPALLDVVVTSDAVSSDPGADSRGCRICRPSRRGTKPSENGATAESASVLHRVRMIQVI